MTQGGLAAFGSGGLRAGTAFIDIRPKLDGFATRLKTEMGGVFRDIGAFSKKDLEKSFSNLGASASHLGATLSKGVSLPLLGLGAIATKFGADFELALSRSVGLAGVAQDEIAGVRQSIFDLSRETGRAPTEIANAFYFIRSSGLAGAEAMNALEVSAKGAVAGLGDTQVVADGLTSALNAYAKSGLTAARAGDVLAATVREGKTEANELANALGHVAPLAAQLGVSFDQLGATFASQSLVGVDTSTIAVNTTQILTSLLKTTPAAAEAMKSVGLNAKDLRDTLGTDGGLLAVMRQVDAAFGDNEEALNRAFPNVRALRGVMALLTQNAEEVDGVFARIKNSTGDFDHAVDAAANTTTNKLRRALQEGTIALIEFGDAAAPIAVGLGNTLGTVARGFSELPGPIKTTAVGFGAMVAAAGPMVFLGGKIASSFKLITAAARGIGGAVSSFSGGLRGMVDVEARLGGTTSKLSGASRSAGFFTRSIGPAGALGALGAVTVALGIGALAIDRWQKKKEEAKQRVIEFTEALRLDNGVLGENTDAYIRNELASKEQLDDLGRLKGFLSSGRSAFDVLTDAIGGSVAAQAEFRRALIDSGEVKINTDPFDVSKSQSEIQEEFIRTGHVANETHAAIIEGNSGLVDSTNELIGDQRKSQAAFEGTADAQRTAAQVATDLVTAETALKDFIASGNTNVEERAALTQKVTGYQDEMRRITDALSAATDDNTQSDKKAITTLEALVDARTKAIVTRNAVATSISGVEDAERDLADARADAAGTGSQAVAAADREADALRGLADAQEGLADAQSSSADARRELAEFDSGTTAQIRALEREQLERRNITSSDEFRQKEIDRLKFGQDEADERARLQEAVVSADDAVADAGQRVADAQRDIKKAAEERKKVQVEAARRIEEGERALAAAVLAVVTSLEESQEGGKSAMQPWIDALMTIEKLLEPGSPLRESLHAVLTEMALLLNPKDKDVEGDGGGTGVGKFAPGSRFRALEGGTGLPPATTRARNINITQNINGRDQLTDHDLDVANRKLGLTLVAAGKGEN